MAIATYKDLCIDAVDAAALGGPRGRRAHPDIRPSERSQQQPVRDPHVLHAARLDHDRRRPKKKEGWLGDIFDF